MKLLTATIVALLATGLSALEIPIEPIPVTATIIGISVEGANINLDSDSWRLDVNARIEMPRFTGAPGVNLDLDIMTHISVDVPQSEVLAYYKVESFNNLTAQQLYDGIYAVALTKFAMAIQPAPAPVPVSEPEPQDP